MIAIAGIEKDMLCTLHESFDVIGTVKADVAAELGLGKNVLVTAGAGDNAAAALGTGTVGSGRCNISIGTSGTIFISSDTFSVDKNNALHSFAHSDGHYHLMGCMLSAGSASRWWMRDILGTHDYPSLEARISESRLGRNNVYFLPYLMGERSPINDTDARGTFTGISMDTTTADLTQSVLEGVAFAFRDSYEIARSLGIDIKKSMNNLSATVKSLRKQFNMTQEDLSMNSGVGLRFVRDLEQGKQTLRLDKVNQLLDFFNYEMAPQPKRNSQ